MNKFSLIALFSVLMFCLGSCGPQTSKQFKELSEEASSIGTQIDTTTDCDDMQMLNFGILGLRSDLDNLIQSSVIPDDEINQLETIVTELEAAWNGKWSSIECDQIIADDALDTSGEEDGGTIDPLNK